LTQRCVYLTQRCNKSEISTILTSHRDLGLDDRVFRHLDKFNINPTYNTDVLINCLRQPGQPHYQHPKSMVLNLSQLIKSCGTRTDPAAETESIGLPAYAQLSLVFAEPSGQLYRDPKLCAVNRDSSIYQDYPIWQLCLDQQAIVRQPGLVHLDCLS
jgi:hypothetical protein